MYRKKNGLEHFTTRTLGPLSVVVQQSISLSVVGCIDADFCFKIFILQNFSISTRLAHFCNRLRGQALCPRPWRDTSALVARGLFVSVARLGRFLFRVCALRHRPLAAVGRLCSLLGCRRWSLFASKFFFCSILQHLPDSRTCAKFTRFAHLRRYPALR